MSARRGGCLPGVRAAGFLPGGGSLGMKSNSWRHRRAGVGTGWCWELSGAVVPGSFPPRARLRFQTPLDLQTPSDLSSVAARQV